MRHTKAFELMKKLTESAVHVHVYPIVGWLDVELVPPSCFINQVEELLWQFWVSRATWSDSLWGFIKDITI